MCVLCLIWMEHLPRDGWDRKWTGWENVSDYMRPRRLLDSVPKKGLHLSENSVLGNEIKDTFVF